MNLETLTNLTGIYVVTKILAIAVLLGILLIYVQTKIMERELWFIAWLLVAFEFIMVIPFGLAMGIYTFIKWRKRPTAKDKQTAAEQEWLKTGRWK